MYITNATFNKTQPKIVLMINFPLKSDIFGHKYLSTHIEWVYKN